MKKINDDVLAVLDQCVVCGNIVRITCGQLDRTMYVAVNKVLEALGGNWNRKVKGHVFDGDPVERIEQAVLTGEYTNKKQDFGFFETPHDLAARLVRTAGVQAGTKVLEPSAGRGSIAKAIMKITAQRNIFCCDILGDNFARLTDDGFMAICQDFLFVKPDPIYDAVVMNPPFAKQADIDHVAHAFKFLKPGGRLVSVMSAGVYFRENKKTVEFRCLVEKHNGNIEKLPEGTFKESGTMVNTIIVSLTK